MRKTIFGTAILILTITTIGVAAAPLSVPATGVTKRQAGSPARIAASVPSSIVDLTFVPLTPCRLVDTRPAASANGPLLKSSTTTFHAIGSSFAVQGGSASDCGVPSSAVAIAINIAMLNTKFSGDVRMWAAGQPMPLAAVGVFSPENGSGVIFDGAAAIIPICQSSCPAAGEFSVYAENSDLDLTVDVSGFFRPSVAATIGVGQGLNWGTIARNVIGNATMQLRNDGTAPSGTGSLEISVGSGTDKAEFGDQVSFAGNPVSALTDIGYVVKTTQENIDAASGGPNMPAIAFEVWTSGTVGVGYSTLNYTPTVNSTANAWSGYIDAANDPSNAWGLTGAAFNSPATAANCGINGPRCTFAQIKALLTTTPYNAIIISAGISKGRDFAWHGEVDSLRINETTYDFEAQGVRSLPTP